MEEKMGSREIYFPDIESHWEPISRSSSVNFELAIHHALTNESLMDRDIKKALENRAFAEPPPWGDIIGKTRPRENPHGIILLNGKIAAKWGDTTRADITFSVAKSFLSICAGLLQDDGLIPDFDAPIVDLVNDWDFNTDKNKQVTWRQMLQMTSEWQGTMWGKPDQIDHNRDLKINPTDNVKKGEARVVKSPGSHWEYNDVRVNRLALSLLKVAKRPLPDLLRERIMEPIGASKNWEWHGYENSWIELENKNIQSVSGGSHWGGGMFISSEDQARVGLLMLNKGVWKGQRLLSEQYIQQAFAPCLINEDYGLFWWLNNSKKRLPSATQNGFCAVGFGSNIIWVEPDFNLVAVVRWIEGSAFDGFCNKVLKVLKS
jgi:CubicO group peptidase (beta-lactamase class C family)